MFLVDGFRAGRKDARVVFVRQRATVCSDLPWQGLKCSGTATAHRILVIFRTLAQRRGFSSHETRRFQGSLLVNMCFLPRASILLGSEVAAMTMAMAMTSTMTAMTTS